jgi:hypothetical protein
MPEEKRKYLRFECLVPVDLVEVDENGQPGNPAFIDNVSREGVRVILDMGAEFGPGKDLTFKVQGPESRQNCSLTGEIVWVKPKGKRVEIGLRIKDMGNCTKSELLDMGYNQWRKEKAKAQEIAAPSK